MLYFFKKLGFEKLLKKEADIEFIFKINCV
jgi:hypothetical protein